MWNTLITAEKEKALANVPVQTSGLSKTAKWGSLAAEEEEVLDWLDQGQVHGIVKDISTV